MFTYGLNWDRISHDYDDGRLDLDPNEERDGIDVKLRPGSVRYVRASSGTRSRTCGPHSTVTKNTRSLSKSAKIDWCSVVVRSPSLRTRIEWFDVK